MVRKRDGVIGIAASGRFFDKKSKFPGSKIALLRRRNSRETNVKPRVTKQPNCRHDV
jgi:hypothetical protein